MSGGAFANTMTVNRSLRFCIHVSKGLESLDFKAILRNALAIRQSTGMPEIHIKTQFTV